MKNRIIVFAIATLISFGAYGGTPDDEAWLISAGHGPGASGSFWVTDLYVMNPNEDPVDVEVRFLPLGMDNSEVEGESFSIGAGELLVLEDVVATLTEDEATVFGALHVEVVEEEDDEEDLFLAVEAEAEVDDYLDDEIEILVYGRAYDTGGDGTRGQALTGLSGNEAISAESSFESTHVIGVSNGDAFRSNWFAVNVTRNEDDEPDEAVLLVELLDESGEIVSEKSYSLLPDSPIALPVSELSVAAIENGSIRFTMEEGSAVVGASRIDNISNDGTTLESFSNSIDPRELEFTTRFGIDSCTFSATGGNPYFPLDPGSRVVLEGEEDGTLISVIIEVTNETRMVDGVMTRVVTETESEDGELVEVSHNFFAECTETGDVFYFGEEVDDYEDGEIVAHEGEWLAGQDGAVAGIIMPGNPLVGSRYYQEVAPGVALDRGEHLARGLEFETEVGTFEDCLVVRDTDALEPSDEGDVKVYCPGIGVVVDGDIEVVEWMPVD